MCKVLSTCANYEFDFSTNLIFNVEQTLVSQEDIDEANVFNCSLLAHYNELVRCCACSMHNFCIKRNT